MQVRGTFAESSAFLGKGEGVDGSENLCDVLLSFVSQRLEKIGQQLAALRLQHAGNDLGFVIETRFPQQVHQRPGASGFRVGGAVDHQRNAGLHDGAGAHRARLERDVQGAVEQPPCPQLLARLANSDDLRVGGWIDQRFAQVMAAPDNAAFFYNDGPNGRFSQLPRLACLDHRLSHPLLVFHYVIHACPFLPYSMKRALFPINDKRGLILIKLF